MITRNNARKIGLSATLLIILLITLKPTTVDAGYSTQIAAFLDTLHHAGVPTWFGYNKLEFLANIIMFIPLGMFLSLTLKTWNWWKIALIPITLSGLIELTQLVLLPNRFATITDFIANSIGALLGIGITRLYTQLQGPHKHSTKPAAPPKGS